MRTALHLKGVEFEFISVPEIGWDEYRRINPQGLMPTLDVDGALLRALMAGWIAGAAAALAATGLLLVVLSRAVAWRYRLSEVRVSLPLVGIIVVNGMRPSCRAAPARGTSRRCAAELEPIA